MPPDVDSGSDARPKDSGKDTGHKDTGTDPDAQDAEIIVIGDDAGPTGTPCATKDAVQQQTCGLCGFQTRVCASNGADVQVMNAMGARMPICP